MAPLAAAHALLVYLATPKNQRTDLLKFFSRHQSAAIEFHENVRSYVYLPMPRNIHIDMKAGPSDGQPVDY
jgi:hypothetical protein